MNKDTEMVLRVEGLRSMNWNMLSELHGSEALHGQNS